jgi:peptide alpha-N-acetyltransferase
MDGGKCVGAIVCKLDMHKKMVRRGYIAMLAVDSDYRRRKIGIVFWSFVNNTCNQK